jgi:acetyl esterase
MSHHRNARALLTPAMHKVLDGMARLGQVPLHGMVPAQARRSYTTSADVLEPPRHALSRIDAHHFPSRDGTPLPVRLYAPTLERLPVLVYFHGGGFVVGGIETHDGLCRRLSHLAHCAVVSVEYRLAPEFKFPTAHNDAWDAVCWVHAQAHSLGLDGSLIALGGDSAGGTLAATCAIEAAKDGLPIALQLLFYPGCAAYANTESHKKFGTGFLLEAPHIAYFLGHYLRSDADRSDWRFAPLDGLTAKGVEVDLAGVAPTWMGLAECDPLFDEGLAYADRLRMAAVPVELEIYRGVVHEFIKMGRSIPQAATAIADAARALKAAFAH